MGRLKKAIREAFAVFHQHDTPIEPQYARTETQRGTSYALGSIRQSKKAAKAAVPNAPVIPKIQGFKAYKSAKSGRMPVKEGWTAGRVFRDGKVEVKGYRNKITGEFIEYHNVSVPDMIYSLDCSIFGQGRTPYSDAYLRATNEQRAQIDERMGMIDWNVFWKYQYNYDPAKGGLTQDGQVLLDWVFEGMEVEEIESTPLGTSSQLYQR